MRAPWLLSFGLLLAACDSPSSGGAPPAPGASAPLCAKAEALRERIAPIEVAASRVPIQDGLTLPEAKDGARVPDNATVVSVIGETFHVEGKETNATDAAALVAKRKEMLKEAGLRAPNAVAVALDTKKPSTGGIEAFLRALSPGTALYFLAAPPGARPEPVPTALEPDFASKDAMQRAGALAVELNRAMARCPQASKLFESLAAAEPDARAPILKEKLPPAVAACACVVSEDLPELVAFALGADAPVVSKHVLLSKDGAALTVGPTTSQGFFDSLPSGGAPVKVP